jgi:drug/metabolite transporter (DMT)-like permease
MEKGDERMTARNEGLLLICVMVALSLVFQIQLKLYTSEIGAVLSRVNAGWLQNVRLIALSLATWRLVFIIVSAICLLGIWIAVLFRLELSLALPLVSVAMAVTALASGIFLGEHLSWTRILGTIVVAAGVALVLRT